MTYARYISVAIVVAMLAGAGFLFYKQTLTPVVLEEPQLPAVPANAQPPAPLEQPRLWRLANDVECLKTKAMRLEKAPSKSYDGKVPIGIELTNTCPTAQIIADIKYSLTALEYVSSRLPQPVAVFNVSADIPKIIKLTRGGDICGHVVTLPVRCKLLSLEPNQRAFIALPDQSWFLVKLADDQKITGFSGLPQDPAHPRPVPKMPDMGFKLKGVGAP